MGGVLIADRIAEHDGMQRLFPHGPCGVNGGKLVGEGEGLPLERMFPIGIDIPGPGRDDLDALVVRFQKCAHGREKAARAELDPAVTRVGDDEDGAQVDGGLEKSEDAGLEDAQEAGLLRGEAVDARVEIGHDAHALQGGGRAARVVPVQDEDRGRRGRARGAGAEASLGGGRYLGEDGGEQRAVFQGVVGQVRAGVLARHVDKSGGSGRAEYVCDAGSAGGRPVSARQGKGVGQAKGARGGEGGRDRVRLRVLG